jgi:uncharacterized protein
MNSIFFPISYQELRNHHTDLIEKRMLKHRLVFGSYPEVVNNPGDEIEILKLISDSYLYQDILMLENIKKPEKLVNLLQALAYQIGNEVSYNEIGNLIGLDSKTVESYIQLLEKSFVIFRLQSFSRNLRNELKLSKKIYFYDNGIRNALISSFHLLEGRQDIGALWENYLVSERVKKNNYAQFYGANYFWRTKDKQEIDYKEDKDGQLSVFEFKWSDKKSIESRKHSQMLIRIVRLKLFTPQILMRFWEMKWKKYNIYHSFGKIVDKLRPFCKDFFKKHPFCVHLKHEMDWRTN